MPVADQSVVQDILRGLQSPYKGISAQYLHAFDGSFTHAHKVHSFGGDLLVQRVRSLSGRKQNLYQAASDLHLRKIGYSCIIDANDACALGKVKKLQHLLRVVPLPSYVPPGKFRLAYWSAGMTLIHETYRKTEAAGESVIVGDAEYLKIESSSDRASITWSSELEAREALSRIQRLAGEPVKASSGYLSLCEDGTSSAGEGHVLDIMEYVEHHSDNIRFAFIPHQNFDVVWAGWRARLISSDVPYTQIGIITKNKIGAEDLNWILMETASPSVSAEARKIVRSMQNAAAPLPELAAHSRSLESE